MQEWGPLKKIYLYQLKGCQKNYEVQLKSIYSEKDAKFEKSLPLGFDVLPSNSQNQVGDFFQI